MKALKEADLDRDGEISVKEFKEAFVEACALNTSKLGWNDIAVYFRIISSAKKMANSFLVTILTLELFLIKWTLTPVVS